MADFKVYYLHGLGSHCESTKARTTKELVQPLGGEFHCKNFNYLMRGDYPWNVVETLKGWVVLDKPTFFVGSSMGAYTWLDFVVNHPEVLENENLKKVFLITPPTTVFDNLEKWNPLFGKEKIFLRYGEDYCKPYETFIRLMHWDLKYANSRLLKLAHPKAFFHIYFLKSFKGFLQPQQSPFSVSPSTHPTYCGVCGRRPPRRGL